MGNNRDNFQWRPNDNSSTTRLRYDLEADHWLKSIKHSQYNKGANNMLGDIGNMFLVLSLAINIVSLIVMVVWEVIKWIIRLFWAPRGVRVESHTPTEWTPPQRTAQEIKDIWNGPSTSKGDIWNNDKWYEK